MYLANFGVNEYGEGQERRQKRNKESIINNFIKELKKVLISLRLVKRTRKIKSCQKE